MNIGGKNIFNLIKTWLMIMFAVLCLTACGQSGGKSDVKLAELEGEESLLDEEQRSCWQGDILAVFYDVMAKSSLKAYPKVTGSAMPFMMVAFALWLSIRVLRHISSVVEESPAAVWTEISRMAFVCLVCGILASSTPFLLFVLNNIIFPIYYTLLEYASLILDSITNNDPAQTMKGIVLGDPDTGVCLPFEHQSMVCKVAAEPNFVGFPTGPSEMMQCLTCALSDRLQIGFAIAKNLLGMESLTSAICGLVVYAVFTIVKIAFVFYMVDSIFRMSIMVILLPCFVLAYPFKVTRKWTKEGFLTILNSAALLTFLAILLAIALAAMQWVLMDNSDALGHRDSYQDFGPVPLSLILISFLVLKSTGIAATMANTLVGGGGNADFQKKIAKAAAWIAKKVFSLITQGTGKLLMKSERLKAMKEKADEARKRFDSMLGRGGDE